MPRALTRKLKSLSYILVTLLLIAILALSGLAMWLRTNEAHQWLFQKGIGMLKDKLQTEVKADSIGIELMRGQVRIYGLSVNDREDSLMLSVNSLHAGIAPFELLDRKVRVTDVEMFGAYARLKKDSTGTNFQFVIDAFKQKKPRKKKQKFELDVDVKELNLNNIHARWDVTHKPRKNLDKPTHGAFDMNHVNLEVDLHAAIRQLHEGAYEMDLKGINLTDFESGLRIEDISTHALWSDDVLRLDNLEVRLPQSSLSSESLAFNIKKMEVVEPFNVRANVVLQDIAQPFAPGLSNFTTPLQVWAKVSGKLSDLQVDDIHIMTPDSLLDITGTGLLNIGSKGTPSTLHFTNVDMRAENEMKVQLVMHFAKTVRLKMMQQMEQIGDIRFRGNLDLLHKKQVVSGRLDTEYGYVDTEFAVQSDIHYLTGYLDTPALEMGKLMNIKNLGAINGHIDFDFNISANAPHLEGALPNGRLPMGQVDAIINNARYKMFRSKKIEASVYSDGSTATGSIRLPKNIIDLIVNVKYIQTDELQHLQVRPRIKLHNIFKRKKKHQHHHNGHIH